MVLHIDSNATYLVLLKAKSRIAGYYFILYYPNTNILATLNKVILVEYKRVKHVITSLAEGETAGVFHNTQTTIPIRHVLDLIGHNQLLTLIKTDNSTASSFINNNIRKKIIKVLGYELLLVTRVETN